MFGSVVDDPISREHLDYNCTGSDRMCAKEKEMHQKDDEGLV
jgi:hypothetical protein